MPSIDVLGGGGAFRVPPRFCVPIGTTLRTYVGIIYASFDFLSCTCASPSPTTTPTAPRPTNVHKQVQNTITRTAPARNPKESVQRKECAVRYAVVWADRQRAPRRHCRQGNRQDGLDPNSNPASIEIERKQRE